MNSYKIWREVWGLLLRTQKEKKRVTEQKALKVYVYSFVPWPDETWNFDRAVYDLFRVLVTRVEMRFTEEGFASFRSALLKYGITLREVCRREDVPVEPVT